MARADLQCIYGTFVDSSSKEPSLTVGFKAEEQTNSILWRPTVGKLDFTFAPLASLLL